jgi:type 1 fimbria pilin
MKKAYLIIPIILFILAGLVIGCSSESAGSLKVKVTDAQNIEVNYSFKNGIDVRLFVNGDQKIICGSGNGSDTYIQTDLQPNTNYTFILRDMGDYSDPAGITLATETIQIQSAK